MLIIVLATPVGCAINAERRLSSSLFVPNSPQWAGKEPVTSFEVLPDMAEMTGVVDGDRPPWGVAMALMTARWLDPYYLQWLCVREKSFFEDLCDTGTGLRMAHDRSLYSKTQQEGAEEHIRRMIEAHR